MWNFVKGLGEIKQGGICLCIVTYSCYAVTDCLDSQYSPDWKPCWTWIMMLCLCKCFHMLLSRMRYIPLHKIHVNEMGL